jgi:GINS complex subunit 2
MAVNLKLKKKCHIVAPEWLNVGMFFFDNSFFFRIFSIAFPLIHFCYCYTDYLQARLTLETSERAYSKLPFRFAEVAKVILDV